MISRAVFAAAFVAACAPAKAQLLTPDLSIQSHTNEPAKRPLASRSTPAMTVVNIIAYENVMKDGDQMLFGTIDDDQKMRLLSAGLRHYNSRRNICEDKSIPYDSGPFFIDQIKVSRINIIKYNAVQSDVSHAKVYARLDLVIEDNGGRFARDMTYDLVYEGAAWKLDDIEYPQQDAKGHARNTYKAFVNQLCMQADIKRPSATADRLLSYSAPSSNIDFPTRAPQVSKPTKAPRLRALLRAAVRTTRLDVERADGPPQPSGVMMLKVRVSAHGSDLEDVRLEALPGKPAFSPVVQSAMLRNVRLIKFDSPDGQSHAYKTRIVW